MDEQVRRELAHYDAVDRRTAAGIAARQPNSPRAMWIKEHVEAPDLPIRPPNAAGTVIPEAFANTAPSEEVTLFQQLLAGLTAFQADAAGLTTSEAAALYHDDPDVLFLREEFVSWGERHVNRRLLKPHPKDQRDNFRTFSRLLKEVVGPFDDLAFRPGSGASVVLVGAADALAWRLYDRTWRSEVEISHGDDAIRIGFPPSRASQAQEMHHLIQLYSWAYADQVPRTIARWRNNVVPAEGDHRRLSARAQLLVEDMLEMKPLLIGGYRPERHAFQLAPGLWCAFLWSLGDVAGHLVLAESEAALLKQLMSGSILHGGAVRLDGRLASSAVPRLAIADDQLGWGVAVLEKVHDRLFTAWAKVDRALAARSSASDTFWADSERIAASIDSIVEAPQDADAPEPLEAEAGTRFAVRPVRMASLLNLLARLGCEVAQGKGSEVTVYRPGGRKFVLGHHTRNRHVSHWMIRRLLRRVGITVEEWTSACGY